MTIFELFDLYSDLKIFGRHKTAIQIFKNLAISAFSEIRPVASEHRIARPAKTRKTRISGTRRTAMCPVPYF